MEELGDITFHSEDIGKWFFRARGKGKKPTEYPMKMIHGALNKEFTGNVVFKNPFKNAIDVYVSLYAEQKRDYDAFFLLLKRK